MGFAYQIKQFIQLSSMANKLTLGFCKADFRNLPQIDSFMIYELITKYDRINGPEVRGSQACQ